ncbi:MAG: hypothetical protein ABIU96_03855 [Rhodanobacter sp.]
MPTPPPLVTCDQTPPPAQLPAIPPLITLLDLAPTDAWILTVIGLYQVEVTIRQGEHRCLRELRSKGVIR